MSDRAPRRTTNEEVDPLDPSLAAPPAGHTLKFRRTFSIGRPPDRGDAVELGPTRRFYWRFGGKQPPANDDELGRPPETYYEALSGRPDPNREFFITARRALGWAVTLTAIAIPVGLVVAAVLGGADPQTIVLLAIFGAIVALMLKSTFPKTPFG